MNKIMSSAKSKSISNVFLFVCVMHKGKDTFSFKLCNRNSKKDNHKREISSFFLLTKRNQDT